MKHSAFGLWLRLFALVLPCAFCTGAIAQTVAPNDSGHGRRPNFILILADDMGYGDSSVYDGWIQTTQMNRMAREGLKFTDFHSSGNICSPTRAGLMTGRYQQRAGIRGVIHTRPGPRHYHGLQPSEITFAELLKDAGYKTAMFGKWHLGYDPKYNPTRHGFDRFRGFLSGNIDYISHYNNRGKYDWWEGTASVQESGYLTHLLTEHAVKYIEDHKDEPFCLYVAHGAVHDPIQAPDSPACRGPNRGGSDPRPRNEVIRLMMQSLDENIGAILDAVGSAGIAGHTLVVFFSDNGPERYMRADPLRGRKGSNWEGGHRVPAIAWWPGRIKPGAVTDELCMSFDLVPTMLDLAGAKAPAGHTLDGMSLVPVFDGGSLGRRQLFWNGVAMRDGPWKLLTRAKGADEPGPLLFNLDEDLGERNNVAAQQPERVKQMIAALEDWKRDVATGATEQPNPPSSVHPALSKQKEKSEEKPSETPLSLSARPPNFVLIFCDDLGYGDLGCFGSTRLRTPNLDAIAAGGIKFTDFYVAAPVCTPSRAALLTGCYPRRVNMDTGSAHVVLLPGDRKGLHPDEITIAELLRPRGYATACVGKWHLGDQPRFLPTRQGFDSYFGIPYSNDQGVRKRKNWPPLPLMRDERVIEVPADQDTLTRRYTQAAVEFIRSNRDRPFFLYLPHTFPHDPLHASPRFRGKSAGGIYGDAVEEIDWSTGEILAELRRLKIARRTLVVFTSDNGAAHNYGGSNLPLRGHKGSTWEGGMRVPCLMAWPGTIPAGAVCKEVVTAMDLLPTFAALAGAELPGDRIIDGRDLSALLQGDPEASSPHEAFYYYRGPDLGAIRAGRWKLHFSRKGGHPEPRALFDLHKDIGETIDQSTARPDVVARLAALAETARFDLGDGRITGRNQRPAGYVESPVFQISESR